MTVWNYIVIILSVAMLALLLVREVRRENRARLRWRIIATILMVTGLAAMALPVGYTRPVAKLPDVPLVFHPSPVGAGVVSIHWKTALWPGEACRIQGRFYNPAGAAVKLLLTGMHTVLDSTELKLREGGDFELRTVPAQVGRAVYRLIALSGADTLEQEAIPVNVLPGKNLKILFLAAAPDFENRFLANWLSDKGHGMAIRTAISKEK